MAKKLWQGVCMIIIGVLIFSVFNNAVTFFSPYSPKSEQALSITSAHESGGKINRQKIRILSFNTAHAALGAEGSVAKEGGKNNRADTDTVLKNVRGIAEIINLSLADVVFLQDVDLDSHRSRYVNQFTYYIQNGKYSAAFSTSQKSRSQSISLFNKKIDSGNMTLSRRKMDSALRVTLPKYSNGAKAFSKLPHLLISKMPIEGSDKFLYVINLDLEKYLDSASLKEQTEIAINYAKSLYTNGNYVVLGGSFYRSFDNSKNWYPLSEKNLWSPSDMSVTEVPSGWSLSFDKSVPTARILSAPYEYSEDRQVYVGDGFILSPNITVNMIATVDQEFRYSAHNPVLIDITLN